MILLPAEVLVCGPRSEIVLLRNGARYDLVPNLGKGTQAIVQIIYNL